MPSSIAPGLADATVIETRVGLRPLSLDGLPYLGEAGDVPGLFVATGFGAAGLTMGPFVGEALAAAILGDPPLADLTPFAPGRAPATASARE